MKKLEWSRKWKVAVAVLLTAVPIGILGTFTLMRGELVELEPIVVEPVSWQMDRPKLDPGFRVSEGVEEVEP